MSIKKIKNIKSNRMKLADIVTSKLIFDPDGIDTDLVYEVLHESLVFRYKYFNDKEFQESWDRLNV